MDKLCSVLAYDIVKVYFWHSNEEILSNSTINQTLLRKKTLFDRKTFNWISFGIQFKHPFGEKFLSIFPFHIQSYRSFVLFFQCNSIVCSHS